AAAGDPFSPAPGGPPLGDAARESIAEGAQSDGTNCADAPALKDRADGFDHRRMLVVVTRENNPAHRCRRLEQERCLADGWRQRLFAQHVQAALERGAGDFAEIRWGGAEIDEVESAPFRLQ